MFLRKAQRKKSLPRRRPGTARRTTIGASSRTSVLPAAVSYSGTFCIWARSTLRRQRHGARPSRFSTTTRDIRGRWRCSRRIDAPALHPIRRSSSFVCRTCGYVDHGNGAPVGWPGSCGGRCSWTTSGPTACQRAARACPGEGPRAYAHVMSTLERLRILRLPDAA